jgi:hypothetical protein
LYERGALPEDQWRIQNINDVYTISASLPIEAQNAAAKVLGWDGFAHIDTRGLAVLPGKLGVRFTWKVEKQSDGSIKVIVCFPGTETPEELFWEDFDSRMIQTPVGGVHEGFWRGIPETVDFLTGIAAEAAKEKG